MKLSLIGYGKMGKKIHQLAELHGHTVVNCLDAKTIAAVKQNELADTIGIDFTSPSAFKQNYRFIADHCLGAIVGTTGWNELQSEITDYFTAQGKPLIYAKNFSIGANLYFEIIKRVSKLIAAFTQYDPYLLEMHHREKIDQPSGTALVISDILRTAFNRPVVPTSVRSGWINGIHEVGYESPDDHIVIKHEAYTREGFAKGVMLALEWMQTETGVWDFQALLAKKVGI